MPSEAEVKIWIEHANEYSRKFDGFNPPWLVGLKSLASSWLGRKDLRKVVGEAVGEASMCWSETPSGVFESTRALGIVNKILDACRLSSVVSEDGIKNILNEFIGHASYIDRSVLAHAIATYINGEKGK